MGIVGQLNDVGNPPAQTVVCLQQLHGGLRISCQYHCELPGKGSHIRNQRVDHILTGHGVHQGICFVYQQNAADGMPDPVMEHLGTGKLRGGGVAHLAGGQQPHFPVQGANHPGGGGFAGAGIAHQSDVHTVSVHTAGKIPNKQPTGRNLRFFRPGQ